MPLLFVGIILIILLTVVLYKKFSKSNRRFGGFFLFLSTLVIWICSFNQYVHIANYADEVGTSPSIILGEFGNILSWIEIIFLSTGLCYLFFKLILAKK